MNEKKNIPKILIVGESKIGTNVIERLFESGIEYEVIYADPNDMNASGLSYDYVCTDEYNIGDLIIEERNRLFKSVLDIKMVELIEIDKKQRKRMKKEQDKWFLKRLGK